MVKFRTKHFSFSWLAYMNEYNVLPSTFLKKEIVVLSFWNCVLIIPIHIAIYLPYHIKTVKFYLLL